MSSLYWEMCYTSFEEFLQYFSRVEAKSLTLTREVLQEREQLEFLIPRLKEQVRIEMAKMDEIKQEEAIMKQFETDINLNKDFEYKIEVIKQEKVNLRPGIHTTICINCNFTCHDDCAYYKDKDKAKCWAMKTDGYCRICPCNCHWSNYHNLPYIIEYHTVEETRTSADLKTKYDTAKTQKTTAEAMIAKNEDQLAQLHAEVHLLIGQTHESIERLKEIALKPNPMTEIEYLDLLIQSEQQDHKPGWQKRVEKYREFRKDAELYKKVADQGVASIDEITAEIDHERPGVRKRLQEYIKQRQEYLKQKGKEVITYIFKGDKPA